MAEESSIVVLFLLGRSGFVHCLVIERINVHAYIHNTNDESVEIPRNMFKSIPQNGSQ